MVMKRKTCKFYPTIIAQNKRVRYEYFIEQEIEAGLSLYGWEVKSLRAGKVNIRHSYVLLKNGEAYLIGTVLQPLTVSSYTVYDPMRIRKLLLNRSELFSLFGYINQRGYTVVVLLLYWKKSWVKAKIGLAKGKKEIDKRINIQERKWQLDKARIMKHVNK